MASALLAVMGAVPDFGRALLRPLGAPAGRIEAFIEVPLELEGRACRPDGIITVSRGQKSWGALVECKTGHQDIDPAQVDLYLDLARALEFDAVITISNQFVTMSEPLPVEVDRRKLRKHAVHHFSWVRILTEAIVQKQHRGIEDPDQAYILGELIRYLSDPRSGVVEFRSMGPHWTAVRDGVRDLTLRKTDESVASIAARWDEMIRYLALDLTKELGRDVRQQVSSQERSPEARQQALRSALTEQGRLNAELSIPDTAGPLEIVADLRARQVTVATRVEAPKEGRSRGRVSWLVRQMANAPESTRIESKVPYSNERRAATLVEVRAKPETLYSDSDREIREFIVSLSRSLGPNRDSGRGSFVDSVMDTTRDFYAAVLQNLRPWKPAPPKLPAPQETQRASEARAEPAPVATPQGDARSVPFEPLPALTEEGVEEQSKPSL